MKCKQHELDEQKTKEVVNEKEEIKLDSIYFRKKLNL
jgi:hypothetical protein